MEAPAPDGSGYPHAGWSFDFSQGEEGERFKLEEALASDAALLGRVTYEAFAQAWPNAEGEMADKFNSVPKYVISSTLKDPEWRNTTVLTGDVAHEVASLKKHHDGDIVVHGSAQLVHELFKLDLVDELRLMVFPVVLGSGKRVFPEMSDKHPLQLVDSKTTGDGVMILAYGRR